MRCFACARQRWQPAASRATFQRVSERVVRTGQVHAAWPPAIGWFCIPDTHAHTPTYTPTHTHPHTHTPTYTPTHTQRHIHYMPHYSPDLPINASLRGPPCSGVYIYIWPLFRALLPVQETNDPYPVLGHDVLRFFAFFSRGRRQGALALKFGSAGSTRVACPTSVPERLEL